MKHSDTFKYLLTTFAFLGLTLSSCMKESPDNTNTGSGLTPDGKVSLSFSAQVTAPDRIHTKAGAEQENDISNLFVLAFDNNRKLSQPAVEASPDATKYKAVLAPNPAMQDIYALANLSTEQKAQLGTFIPGQTSYEEVRAALASANGTAAGLSAPFPMCSEVIRSVISPSMGGKTVIMKRAVARIDIDATSLDGSLFRLESVTLLNAAARGFILPSAQPAALYANGDVIRYNEQAASSNQVTSAVYCYENGGILPDNTTANPTRLLVKGSYKNNVSGYYLLHVVYTKADDPNGIKRYDICRNTIYTVNITGVDTPGYITEAEALVNKPTNDITYNVTVTDPDSHDIISNGDYYMGFSNSDCLVFSSEEANNITVAILTHNAPASVTTRSVTVSGTELTLIGNPLSANADTPVPVIVNIGRNFSKGSLSFRLGNLLKTLDIERRENNLSFGGTLALGPDYVLGDMLRSDPLAENWLKFTENQSNGFNMGTNRIVSSTGEEVYIVFEHNIITQDGTSRNKYEEAYLSRAHESGRTKAIFYQHPYNMIKLDGKPVQDTYVATFHRHDQTGERIITLENPQVNGLWLVEVVAGKDFIKIAPGLHPNPDPNLYNDNFNDAENYPVEGNATQLIGTDNTITFRVGMKGTIDSTENRYGLILITHATGSNRIFVRQGQAADYIMRDIDPIAYPASVTSPNRPHAVKFAPFNLTDPLGRTGRVDLSIEKGGFTQYPSQGGYLFHAFKPYAWYPTGWNPVNWISSTEVVANWEVCPDGYRRPKDGPDDVSAAGNVIDSELRQSLWYNPKNGNWSSDYENILRGAVADGFFDRQQIKTPVAGDEYGTFSLTPKPCFVNSGARIGVSGQVIFNPTTFASIFIPATGSRNAFRNGQLYNLGLDVSIWSGTYTEGSTWCASMIYWLGNFTFDNERTSNNNGLTVRCVRKKTGEP